jgi:hypothetical protein
MTNLRPKAGMACSNHNFLLHLEVVLGSGREPARDELRVLLQPETEPPQSTGHMTKSRHQPAGAEWILLLGLLAPKFMRELV